MRAGRREGGGCSSWAPRVRGDRLREPSRSAAASRHESSRRGSATNVLRRCGCGGAHASWQAAGSGSQTIARVARVEDDCDCSGSGCSHKYTEYQRGRGRKRRRGGNRTIGGGIDVVGQLLGWRSCGVNGGCCGTSTRTNTEMTRGRHNCASRRHRRQRTRGRRAYGRARARAANARRGYARLRRRRSRDSCARRRARAACLGLRRAASSLRDARQRRRGYAEDGWRRGYYSCSARQRR